MNSSLWQLCLEHLKKELTSMDFNIWFAPLIAQEEKGQFILYAPNQFVAAHIKKKYLTQLHTLLEQFSPNQTFTIVIKDGRPAVSVPKQVEIESERTKEKITPTLKKESNPNPAKSNFNVEITSGLNPQYTFLKYVEGKSNQLATAAAKQVAENPGGGYNPLFIYGATGLGKTHLIQAIGNEIQAKNKKAKVIYMHSERFVQDMVKALKNNCIEEFKQFYRSVDALLIDDIQFFAKKNQSQEEFFHTFNALLEGNRQVIMTSDRYPKEIEGVEDRLKSRFGWGLTVSIEPPELETRVAILLKKADEKKIELSNEVAFFIAQRIRSNVRELEGALNRVMANADFTGKSITIDFVKDALKDLITLQEKLVTIDNIQKTVAEYYKLKVSDILSKRRSRSVARPRQMAMCLSKELTNKSLPEIGEAFGGKDHTTVLHACRKMNELREQDNNIKEDYTHLIRILSN